MDFSIPQPPIFKKNIEPLNELKNNLDPNVFIDEDFKMNAKTIAKF
jgi:hypothetical protein